MSQDDGWIIRETEPNRFYLQHYFASADSWPSIDKDTLCFDTLEGAVREFVAREAETYYPSEYGLTIKLYSGSQELHSQ